MSEMDEIVARAAERLEEHKQRAREHRRRGEEIDNATAVVLMFVCCCPVIVFVLWALIVGFGGRP